MCVCVCVCVCDNRNRQLTYVVLGGLYAEAVFPSKVFWLEPILPNLTKLGEFLCQNCWLKLKIG